LTDAIDQRSTFYFIARFTWLFCKRGLSGILCVSELAKKNLIFYENGTLNRAWQAAMPLALQPVTKKNKASRLYLY